MILNLVLVAFAECGNLQQAVDALFKSLLEVVNRFEHTAIGVFVLNTTDSYL